MIAKIVNGFMTILVGSTLIQEIAKAVENPFYQGNGLIGWTVDKEEKPKRQTYKEYVQERLEVEKMMRHGV